MMKQRTLLLLALIFALSCSALCETSLSRYIEESGLDYAQSEIAVLPSEYSAIDMQGFYTMEDGSLYTASSGWVEYTVSAPQSALYAVRIRYYPGKGTGADI